MPSGVRIYRSYEDFERDELHRLEHLSTSLDDLLDDGSVAELDFGAEEIPARRRRRVDED